MTKQEDELSSVRTLKHLTLVMLVMSEVLCLISAYKWNINPGLHFNIIAFGLPLLAAAPYIASLQGHRLLHRVENQLELPNQLALSRQLSSAALTAYSLFIFAMAVAGSTNR